MDMKPDQNIPSVESLASAKSEYIEKLKGIKGSHLMDTIITPFVNAVFSEGYTDKRIRGGCSKLDQCTLCRNNYVFTFVKEGGDEIQLCPHCRAAADHKKTSLIL